MNFDEELELVPPECRYEMQMARDFLEIEEHCRKSEQALSQMELHEKVITCDFVRKMDDEKLVFVTFYTHLDKKVVRMHLIESEAHAMIARKAAELLPTIEWKIYSGTQHERDFEFVNSSQIWNSIKRSPIIKFYYLLVRLERAHPVNTHEAVCDNCRQPIVGHRFKCTECADFDICQNCEAKPIHREHAMLRIVDSGTRIPNYITRNAPDYVFGIIRG